MPDLIFSCIFNSSILVICQLGFKNKLFSPYFLKLCPYVLQKSDYNKRKNVQEESLWQFLVTGGAGYIGSHR